MILSSRERRALADIERELSRDSVLAKIAGLFAEPAGAPSPDLTTANRRRPTGRLLLALATLVGVASMVIACTVGPTFLAALGILVAAGAGISLIVKTEGAHAVRAPAPLIRK